MGKGSAAGVASNIRIGYLNIQLALVVGIIRAVSFPDLSTEILLGDVVISDSIIEYDFGRQYPGRFIRKRDAKTTLGRPNREIRSILTSPETEDIRQKFHDANFQDVQSLAAKSTL